MLTDAQIKALADGMRCGYLCFGGEREAPALLELGLVERLPLTGYGVTAAGRAALAAEDSYSAATCPQCAGANGRVRRGFVTCGTSECQEAEYHANAERAARSRRRRPRRGER